MVFEANDGVKRRKTREWLRERAKKDMFYAVVQLLLQDPPAFKEMMRMSPDQFAEILNAIGPDTCNHEILFDRHFCCKWREKRRLEK